MTNPGDNIDYFTDQVWRVETFSENEDQNARDNRMRIWVQRIPFADAGKTQPLGVDPIKEEVAVQSLSDGGKPRSVVIETGTGGLNSPQAKALSFAKSTTFLDDSRQFLKQLYDEIVDQAQSRRILDWRLAGSLDGTFVDGVDPEYIDQSTYDTDLAALVPTTDG